MATTKVFGDPTGFAIHCVTSEESTPDLAYCCHWILNNNLVGDAQEPCYLPTWTAALVNFKRWQLPKIIASPFAVNVATASSIFTTPCERWDEATRATWETHRINLDETQDAWQLMAYFKQEHIVFVGQGWRAPCPVQDIGRTFTVTASYASVLQTINECLRHFGLE